MAGPRLGRRDPSASRLPSAVFTSAVGCGPSWRPVAPLPVCETGHWRLRPVGETAAECPGEGPAEGTASNRGDSGRGGRRMSSAPQPDSQDSPCGEFGERAGSNRLVYVLCLHSRTSWKHVAAPLGLIVQLNEFDRYVFQDLFNLKKRPKDPLVETYASQIIFPKIAITNYLD